jgi:hypothetical protein
MCLEAMPVKNLSVGFRPMQKGVYVLDKGTGAGIYNFMYPFTALCDAKTSQCLSEPAVFTNFFIFIVINKNPSEAARAAIDTFVIFAKESKASTVCGRICLSNNILKVAWYVHIFVPCLLSGTYNSESAA